MSARCSVVVLISGNGSNLQALIDASGTLNYAVIGVISNNPDAYGLVRARNNSIPAFVVNHRDFPDRVSFDKALIEVIDRLNPDLIVLAGFMRILSPQFINHFTGNILNIHPSLLPSYPGTHTHQRVLAAGEKEHGVSVHFVTEELDGGPIAGQAKIEVIAADTVDTLTEKAHAREHQLYPHIVSLYAGGELRVHTGKVWLNDKELPKSGILLK